MAPKYPNTGVTVHQLLVFVYILNFRSRTEMRVIARKVILEPESSRQQEKSPHRSTGPGGDILPRLEVVGNPLG